MGGMGEACDAVERTANAFNRARLGVLLLVLFLWLVLGCSFLVWSVVSRPLTGTGLIVDMNVRDGSSSVVVEFVDGSGNAFRRTLPSESGDFVGRRVEVSYLEGRPGDFGRVIDVRALAIGMVGSMVLFVVVLRRFRSATLPRGMIRNMVASAVGSRLTS